MIRLARLLESFGHFSLHNPNLDHGNCKQYEDAGDVHGDNGFLFVSTQVCLSELFMIDTRSVRSTLSLSRSREMLTQYFDVLFAARHTEAGVHARLDPHCGQTRRDWNYIRGDRDNCDTDRNNMERPDRVEN